MAETHVLDGNTTSSFKRLGDFKADFLGSTESLAAESIADCSIIDGPNIVEALENNYKDKRDELITPDGLICTPLKVLKDVAFQFGVPIELTTFEVHMPVEVYGFDTVRNRVTLNVGPFTGHGESTRHRMAVQLAAADLLEHIKNERKEANIAEYGLLVGCRTNPMIYDDLRELCRLEKLAGMPVYTQLRPSEINCPELFAFRCTIGQYQTVGASDSIFLAKRIAARAMFEILTDEPYPDDHVAAGKACLTEEDFRAMGINPVTSARAKQRIEGARLSTQLDSVTSSLVRRSDFGVEDIHDDDFAEEEDTVILMRQQLTALNISQEDKGKESTTEVMQIQEGER